MHSGILCGGDGEGVMLRSAASAVARARVRSISSLLFLLVLGSPLVAQTAGDYRSKQSGTWSDPSTWEVYNGSVWIDASSTPTSSDGVITIRSPHIVTINSTVTYDQLVVQAGAQVTVASGVTHTLANGTDPTDLTIHGIWLNQGGTWTTSGNWSVAAGGTYIHNTSAAVGSNIDKGSFDDTSIFEYRDGVSTPSLANRTYGNLRFTTATTKTFSSASGSNPLTINGSLYVGPNVTFSSGSFAGNITVQEQTLIEGIWTGSGSGNLGMHAFNGSFTIAPGGVYSLATTGATQGDIVFGGDLTVNGTFTTPGNRDIRFISEGSQTISGSSTIVFNNGFESSSPLLTIASGTNVQLAAGTTAEIYSDLTVDGTLSGADASTSVVSFVEGGSSFTLPSSGPGASITLVKVQAGVGAEGTLYFSGIGVFGSGASFVVDNASAVRLVGHATVAGGSLIVANGSLILNDGEGSYTLTLKDASLMVGSSGSVQNAGLVKTQGNSTIDQQGSFNAPLVVEAGMTSAYGTNPFLGDVTVGSEAALTVPALKTLTTAADVSILDDASLTGAGTFVSNSTGVTIANSGIISVAAAQINGGASPKYLAGAGTWSEVSLTIAAGCSLELNASQYFSSCSITNHGSIEIFGHAFRLIDGTFTNASDGYVHGYYDSFETEGTVTLIQNGGFNETLVVRSGTTTTEGVFQEPIIVKPQGTLSVPSGKTLTAEDDVTVERTYEDIGWRVGGGKPSSERGAPVLASSARGAISGAGTLLFRGYAKTFDNDGVVSVVTIFEDNDGDTKLLTTGAGGTWSSLTIASDCSTSIQGTHTFTGAPVPFVVEGTVSLLSGATIIYGGSALQTAASLPYINLIIDNSANVKLAGPTSVSGQLVLLNGDLLTESETLTLGPLATIEETPVHTVIGRLTTTRICSTGVNESFGGIGVEINAAGSAPGSTVVTRYTGSAPAFSGGIPIKRYFDISPTTNSGLNAAFVFRYLDDELNGNVESGIQLYKSTDGGSTWSAQGGSVNTTENTLSLSGVDQFSRWTAGGAANPAPSITMVSPVTFVLGQTADISVAGTGFVAGITGVSLGSGVTVNSVTVHSATSLTANVTISPGAAVGTRSLTVTNAPPGGGTAAESIAILYPGPSLTSVSPNSADRGETVDVTVTGDGFYEGLTTVDFGPQVAVLLLTFVNETQLIARVAIAPAAATGARDVTATNAGPGGGSAVLDNSFTIKNPVPQLLGLFPAHGNRGQTLDVVLSGSKFIAGVTAVTFDGEITVNSTTVESDTQLTANITIDPTAATGARSVTVTHPAPGGGSATLENAFSVGNPVPSLASVTPGNGRRGRAETLTLSGGNFITGVTSIDFGPGITVDSFSVSGLTAMTAYASIQVEAATGARDITVVNAAPGGGSAVLAGGFNVVNPAPVLVGITPASASRGETLTVTAAGSDFIPGVTSFDYGTGITINSISSFSSAHVDALVTIVVDAATGPRSVTVSNSGPGGGSMTLENAFTIQNPPPRISSISPSSAGRGSRINVVVTGAGFISGVTSVSFGADITVNSVTVNGLTQLTANISIAAAASTGTRNVTVTNGAPGGGTASLTGSFTVDTSTPTSLEEGAELAPEMYVLREAFPNPFNPVTKIQYGVPERSRVKIEVYNMLGNVVAVLADREQQKGYYEAVWVAESLPSGVYLIRMHAEPFEKEQRKAFIASRKVILVK